MIISYVTKSVDAPKIRIMTVFGERLRAWREAKNISGWRIEKILGIRNFRMIISNVETGLRRPSDEFIEKLASIQELGIPLAKLLAWRAMDDYGPDALREAIGILEKEQSE